MASSYLSLIQIINVLHNQQDTDVPTETHRLAKLFAHKLLERGLEHLDPDARFLLLLLEKTAPPPSAEFHMNQKELKKITGWNWSRLKSSLERLLNGKYLRKHPRKKSSAYELIYDSTKERRIDYVMKPQGPFRKLP